MKKSSIIRLSLALTGLLALSLTAASCAPEGNVTQSVEFTAEEFKHCYSDDSVNRKITFLLDTEMWGITEELTDAHVRGSFTSWNDEEEFKLIKSDSGKYYYTTVSYDKLTNLGNSGHPEYKFNTDGTNDGYLLAQDIVEEPYCFHTSDYNLILIFAGEDIAEITACSKQAGTWRFLADWNLDSADNKTKDQFANFRAVPGTTCVYRSWHPFKAKYSKDSAGKKFLRNTEPSRNAMVISLYEKYGIKTDICLSGDETTSDLKTYNIRDTDLTTVTGTYTESVPSYYQSLIDAGNVCNVTYTKAGETTPHIPEYPYIYQSSYDEELLNGWLQNLIDFVKEDHPAPYNVHCRLGNDRTGYYCAVIAGLCGATWTEITADYQSSNNTYLGEYRDQRLLKQVFEKQYKISDMNSCTNLKDVMYNYYQTNDVLKITKEDLDALVTKFTAR